MPNLRQILVQRLESLQRAGVQQVPKSVIPLAAASSPAVPPAALAPAPAPIELPPAAVRHVEPAVEVSLTEPRPMPRAANPLLTPGDDSLILKPYPARPESAPKRQAELDQIRCTVQSCTKCPILVRNRTQTVFGVGNLKPQVVFFGEAPGADEDKQGEPFVGKAGQLLNKIIEACTWKREEVYILNTLKCRPPDNRTPAEDEIANCRPFWQEQLEILRPAYIVCLGAVAAQTLMETTVSVGKLRGKLHQYRDSQVLITYHPAYLLRNPDAKRLVWEDMQILLKELGVSLPQRKES